MLIFFILAFIIGVSSGLVTFIFGTGLNLISQFIVVAFPYNLILLPFVGFLTVRTKKVYKQQVDNSMPRIFAATRDDSKLSILILPFQFVTTWLAHLAGASVGREGVAVQMGATLANYFARLVPDVDRKDMTRIGMAAGFAGLFGTPLAATVFSFEVTKKKPAKIELVIATLVATYTANFISGIIGLSHFKVDVEFVMFDVRQMIFFIFSVVGFVVLGHLFALGLKKMKELNQSIKLKDSFKIIIFSIIGGLLLCYIADGRYMSLGTNIINDAFYNPGLIQPADFLFKMLFTMYFVGIGFQGGEVTPLFAIGSAFGILISSIFSLPYLIVAGVGYAFTFGNATNAYFASAVLAVEVFGIGILPYALIALAITTFIRNDSHTIYPNLEWV